MKKHHLLSTVAFSVALASGMLMMASPSYAEDGTRLERLEKQMALIQKEISEIKAEQTEKTQTQKLTANATDSDKSTTSVTGRLKEAIKKSTGVEVSLGGFFDATGIARSKNQGNDGASDWNSGIPFDNHTNAHQREYRASARNTRLSLSAKGSPDSDTTITGYVEADFGATAVNSNTLKNSGYTPRFRQGWLSYDRSDLGLHLLAGQAWSLATQNAKGIAPGTEYLPMVLDSGLMPGTVWTRETQFRVVKDFADKKAWVGLSLEQPSTNYAVSSVATTYGANPAAGNTANTVTSDDIAPDLVLKAAVDHGIGHYEIFGIGRTFHDRYSGTNNTAFAASGGASALFKTLSGKLDVTANFLAGQAIGRYGSVMLPDVVFTPSGDIKPTVGYAALFGLIGHPTPTWDIFTYAGVEQVNRENYDGQGSTTATGIGYGNNSLDTGTCYAAESSTACAAQTRRVWQITGGAWKSLYKGDYGNFKIGVQHSLTRRDAFSGSTGLAPHSFENISLVSFRYIPSF